MYGREGIAVAEAVAAVAAAVAAAVSAAVAALAAVVAAVAAVAPAIAAVASAVAAAAAAVVASVADFQIYKSIIVLSASKYVGIDVKIIIFRKFIFELISDFNESLTQFPQR